MGSTVTTGDTGEETMATMNGPDTDARSLKDAAAPDA
jgi:hypothetical protein